MSDRSSSVLKEALTLPPSERAQLAEELMRSLEPRSRRRIDELWAEEAESRISAFERGDIESSSAEDVFRDANRKKM